MNKETLTITHGESSFKITGTSYQIGRFSKWAKQYHYGELLDGYINCLSKDQYDQCRRQAKRSKLHISDC